MRNLAQLCLGRACVVPILLGLGLLESTALASPIRLKDLVEFDGVR